MKPKVLLLSNSMLFHYSFCSFNKNQFIITPLLMRYIKRNLQKESEHYYIQIQEQKKKHLANLGVLTEPHRLSFTRKYLQELIDLCFLHQYDVIVVEIMSGTAEEIMLLKALQTTNIPIQIYAHSLDVDFYRKTGEWYVENILSITDLLKIS